MNEDIKNYLRTEKSFIIKAEMPKFFHRIRHTESFIILLDRLHDLQISKTTELANKEILIQELKKENKKLHDIIEIQDNVIDWAKANVNEMDCRGDDDCDHCHLFQLLHDLSDYE